MALLYLFTLSFPCLSLMKVVMNHEMTKWQRSWFPGELIYFHDIKSFIWLRYDREHTDGSCKHESNCLTLYMSFFFFLDKTSLVAVIWLLLIFLFAFFRFIYKVGPWQKFAIKELLESSTPVHLRLFLLWKK